MSYDLRRLRLHGLIERIEGTHRYQVTDHGLAIAVFLTRVHNRLIRTGLAQLTDPDPPAPSRLRASPNRLHTQIDDYILAARLAA